MTDSSEAPVEPETWPDTTNRPPPQGHATEAIAVWLLGRHPHLAELLARADCVTDEPDAIDLDPEHMPYPIAGIHANLKALTYDFKVFDEWQSRPLNAPREPVPVRGELLAAMEPGEQCQLRLLATLTWGTKLCLEEDGLVALDDAGRRVLHDWLDAVRAEWGTPHFTGPVGDRVPRPTRS